MSVLKLDKVSIAFGGLKALSDISLTVEKGQIVGIIGPNGAGKTTLFNLLTGMYVPTSGEILFKKNDSIKLNGLKPYKITSYGIARTFQNIRLFGDMTVLDNVKMGFHSRTKCGFFSSVIRLPSYYDEERKVNEEAIEMLKILNLESKKDELAKSLPYGEQRRLEIARALASKPSVLLLDEPAAGMNPNETKELTNFIAWIREKFDLTIILIEHDIKLVMGICNKVYVLNYGNLIAGGTPEEVQKNPQVIEAYIGSEGA
ncbi:MAG: ABC transporter ATP-binding protein [Clostridiales bacterium]|jgi:branched-chain amino acid transport system ATP-binding protein|nr:ABC transporter ATP-binding protein [Clostridiales bacterium]